MPYNKLLFSVELLLPNSPMDSPGAVHSVLRPVAVSVQVEPVVHLGLLRRRAVQTNESVAMRLRVGLAVRVLAARRVVQVRALVLVLA